MLALPCWRRRSLCLLALLLALAVVAIARCRFGDQRLSLAVGSSALTEAAAAQLAGDGPSLEAASGMPEVEEAEEAAEALDADGSALEDVAVPMPVPLLLAADDTVSEDFPEPTGSETDDVATSPPPPVPASLPPASRAVGGGENPGAVAPGRSAVAAKEESRLTATTTTPARPPDQRRQRTSATKSAFTATDDVPESAPPSGRRRQGKASPKVAASADRSKDGKGAAAAAGRRRAKKGDTTAAKARGVIDMILDAPLTPRFNMCALIGSAAFLKGRSSGKEIDAHDTVIRVNRIPTPKYFDDFGQRTDVLFTGLQADGYKLYTQKGMWYRLMGGKIKLCAFNATDCPFAALVLKGSDSSEYGQLWEARYPLGSPGWKPKKSTFPLGHQAEIVNQFAYRLANGMRPSNGLHAFVTFGLLCNSLKLYGFSGKGTADGHNVKAHVHDIHQEHKTMYSIISGKAGHLGPNWGPKWDPWLAKLQSKGKQFSIVEP
mmetsp:Transcript_83666/g.270492  ORF Transcript_83666/g.270492 Transcript_83666/m.270492 type:complete len:491 (+) Transcript_83666:84-1556(+)